MIGRKASILLALSVLLALVAGCGGERNEPVEPDAAGDLRMHETALGRSEGFTVFASGFDNPRGLEFGPDGYLYVAEGGKGGSNATAGECDQVAPPIGPYTGSPDGSRISKVSPGGEVTPVLGGLPSSQTSAESGSLVSGVADIAFIGETLYALIAGAGCSHGVPEMPNSVIRVEPDGTWTLVADLSEYYLTHPVAEPSDDDYEPDGVPYSMTAVRGFLAVVEANHGEVDWVIPSTGNVRRIFDISEFQGHSVPTSAAYGGNFYVANLGTFPIRPGTQKVLRINQSGRFQVRADGLTAVTGIAFDEHHRLYVLEMSTAAGDPAPGTGRVVRVSRSGNHDVVVDGLTFPTAMTFGPDLRLYISNFGFGFPAGSGEVVVADVRR